MSFFTKFRIPTLLGLAIIILGTSAGVFLVLNQQTITSFAGPDTAPQNITFSNIEDNSVIISWKTVVITSGFVTFGLSSPNEKTALDDRDTNTPQPRQIHYVTLKDLSPQSEYKFKIVAGRQASEILTFKTAPPKLDNNGFKPIIGSVVSGNQPLKDGIVYLSIAGATTQSSLIKDFGNFIIPISNMKTDDLGDAFKLEEDTLAKLIVISADSQGTAIFKIRQDGETIGVIKIGQNLDLTAKQSSPSPSPSLSSKEVIYDLNSDGKINASDHAIVLKNFGKSPKDKRADLNSDGVVNQKDLDLISKRIDEIKSSN
ncbi:fibronectin type III domain-containing protein [Candidatus Daviesbacteria bacterium]|nr:fibronectin type III domain-containing protein [Candidatus Daviesbacteria bacterium]